MSLDALLGNVKSDGVDVELGGGLNVKAPLSATYNPASKVIDVELDTDALGGGLPAPTNEGDVLTVISGSWQGAPIPDPTVMFIASVRGGAGDSTNVSGGAFVELTGTFDYATDGSPSPLFIDGAGTCKLKNGGSDPIRVLATFSYCCDRDASSGGFELDVAIDKEGDVIGETSAVDMMAVDVPNNKIGYVSVQRWVILTAGQSIKPCVRIPSGTYGGSVTTLHASLSVSGFF